MSVTAEVLKASVRQGRVPHAVLFTGERGSGRNDAALSVAAVLLCAGDHKPCGDCRGCRLFTADTHPDFVRVEPEKGTIKTDAVRRVLAGLREKPFGDACRAVLIQDAQDMTPQAQNCLLKTLEEPPERAVFLLVCHSERELLPTIVSRCQTVRMPGEPLSAVSERLASGLRLDRERAGLIARLSQGHYARALEWADENGPMALREGLFRLLSELCGGSADPLSGYAFLQSHKEDTLRLLDVLRDILTDVLLIKQGGAARNTDHARELERMAARFYGPALQRLMEYTAGLGGLLNRNVHHQMLMEDLLLKIKDAMEDSADGKGDRRTL